MTDHIVTHTKPKTLWKASDSTSLRSTRSTRRCRPEPEPN